MTRQPAISFSISSQHHFNRAGGRKSNVLLKMNRHIIHGIIVAAAMLLFGGFALGTFGLLGWSAVAVWGVALMAGGFILRRVLWREFGTGMKVLGVAILISFLGIVGLAFLGDTFVPLSKALSAGWQAMAVHYLPFFWLPFVLGLIAGGLQGRNRLAEQAGGSDGGKPPI